MAIGTADVVMYSKQTGFAISCTESAKDPLKVQRDNRAVRRNADRFPEDFMFQLTSEETEALRCQIGISNVVTGRGGRRFRPYVFTEQGIAMLSGVLTSVRAVQVNVAIMRTFVRLRQLLATHEELARRLERSNNWNGGSTSKPDKLKPCFRPSSNSLRRRSRSRRRSSRNAGSVSRQRRMTTEPQSRGKESSHG
jgi:hypothetical protein